MNWVCLEQCQIGSSTQLHYNSLLSGWWNISIDDPYRGPTMNDKDHLSSWVTDLIGRCIEDIEKTKSFALNIFSFLN